MSSFLCFICHSTVNADTNEEMRDKYREIVGMNLCPDSHLCHICCHVMNRLWLFRSVCLKRSLEYPVLFSEKGTINLQRNDLEIHTVCFDDCDHYKSRNINSKYYHFTHYDDMFDSNEKYNPNEYVELEDERQDFDEFANSINNKCYDNNIQNEPYQHVNEYNFNEDRVMEESNKLLDIVGAEHGQDVKELDDRTYDHDEALDDLEPELNDDLVDTGQGFDGSDEENNTDCESRTEPNPPVHNEINNLENIEIKEEPKSVYIVDQNLENQSDESVTNVKKKKKKKKHKKDKEDKKFDKFLLSVEEQRAELEAKRKEDKYIEAEFKCYNCAMGFLFKDTYQAHMMRHEESNGEHLCRMCGLRFASMAVLRAHTALHAERHRCVQCGLVVRRRHRAEHERVCFGLAGDSAACHLCGRVFKDSKALQQHIKRFHRARSRPRACGVCGQPCRDHAAVRTHMLKHLQRRFPCSCGARLRSPHALRAHRLRDQRHQHGDSASIEARAPKPTTERPALCHLCGAPFKCNSKLNRHLREVCERDKLEEELSSYYAPAQAEC